jgi:hypothetical protein
MSTARSRSSRFSQFPGFFWLSIGRRGLCLYFNLLSMSINKKREDVGRPFDGNRADFKKNAPGDAHQEQP